MGKRFSQSKPKDKPSITGFSVQSKPDTTIEERVRKIKSKIPRLPKKPTAPDGEIFTGTKRYW